MGALERDYCPQVLNLLRRIKSTRPDNNVQSLHKAHCLKLDGPFSESKRICQNKRTDNEGEARDRGGTSSSRRFDSRSRLLILRLYVIVLHIYYICAEDILVSKHGARCRQLAMPLGGLTFGSCGRRFQKSTSSFMARSNTARQS